VSGYGTFKTVLYNNTAFRNGTECNGQGFSFQQPDVENVLKNNLSFKNPRDYVYPVNISLNNSWNRNINISESDFQSLDTAGVSGARKGTGDLPDIPFLKPVQNSSLIDAGVDVGCLYYGNAPDIGAFEAITGDSQLNKLPSVNITSPSKGLPYTTPANVIIDVQASDPDGTIDKVELFNGTEKLGEITIAPYSFVLKDLPEGIYLLKAVATDNQNATSSSTIFELKVISNNEKNDFLNLFPNPNNGFFFVNFTATPESDYYTVTIVDLNGKIVYEEKISADENTKQFDIIRSKQGLYTLIVSANQILMTQKFIKN
jgi:hypothetical protein